MKTIYVFRDEHNGDIFEDVFSTHQEATNHAQIVINHKTEREKKQCEFSILSYNIDVPENDTRTASELYDSLFEESCWIRDPDGYEKINA